VKHAQREIKYFFLLLIILAVVLGGYFLSLDSHFKVSRERKINAPANLGFNQIADLRNWEKWAPWKEKDSTFGQFGIITRKKAPKAKRKGPNLFPGF